MSHWLTYALPALLTLLAACGDGPAGTSSPRDTDSTAPSRPDGGVSDGGVHDSDSQETDAPDAGGADRCDALSNTYDTLFCAHDIADLDTWRALTLPSTSVDVLRLTKFVMAANDTLAIPLSFLNVSIHPRHYDFLVAAFPETFNGISPVTYLSMAMDGPERPLLVGSISEYLKNGENFYGFTILDNSADPTMVVTESQARLVYDALSAAFHLGSLRFVPETSAQREAAKRWSGAIPVDGVTQEIPYEVYTMGTGFGTVRLMNLADLDTAVRTGQISYQDILVLDEAPADLEAVVSGTVTGTRQGVLSHLNVRSAARGTPNCYVPDPHDVLAAWADKLVRLICGKDGLEIEETTREAAEAAWVALRPEPLELRNPDTTFEDLPLLGEIPTETVADRRVAADRVGSKAANLAVLYQRIDPTITFPGFAVPFHYFQAFMTDHRFTAETADGDVDMSFEEALDTWLDDADFQTDTVLRRHRLDLLREAMLAAAVDPVLLSRLETAITAVFKNETTMVRFRSSSNAEDALAFSGAGLYDSESACLADTLDGDILGPSLCDSDKGRERDIETALKTVWASLYTAKAFEERAFYGIDHQKVKMGILVNPRTKNEAANIVAFTGNPITGDDDYLINAQLGELDVVSSAPGVYPESTALEMDGDTVHAIQRLIESSETVPGEVVLSDALLTELGAHLAHIEAIYPVDTAPPEGRQRFFDTEWKLLESKALVIKQIRPFLY